MKRIGLAFVVLALLLGTRAQAAVESLTFMKVDAGRAHTCAITLDGFAYCWGSNYLGQLGDGTTDERQSPRLVKTANGFSQGQVTDISAGLTHTCAATADGLAFCWGYNGAGRLGNESSDVLTTVPVRVGGLAPKSVSSVVAGGKHSCVLDLSGTALCWGANEWGQLGDGTVARSRAAAQPVRLGGRVVALSAGTLHTCAVTAERELFCFGANLAGQLGDGTAESAAAPRRVLLGAGLTPGEVAVVSAGDMHTCAATLRGSVYCWGSNNWAQLGYVGTDNQRVPARVLMPPRADWQVRSLAAGARHTCALASDGAAYCWGDNTQGQLGAGLLGLSPMPLRVHALDGLDGIAAGDAHSCATSTGGGLWCWGSDLYGEGGTSPAPVTPLPQAVA